MRFIEEGWGRPGGSKRSHYFIGTEPLCSSKVRFLGIFEDRADDSEYKSGDCQGCRWRAKERLKEVRVYAKVGTHAQQRVAILKPFKGEVGERVTWRDDVEGSKPETGIIRIVKDVGYPLYFIERF